VIITCGLSGTCTSIFQHHGYNFRRCTNSHTKHGREFKEAWYSTDGNTINRHIGIPTIYSQLKTKRRNSLNDLNMTNTD
jgi:hypothetical protein